MNLPGATKASLPPPATPTGEAIKTTTLAEFDTNPDFAIAPVSPVTSPPPAPCSPRRTGAFGQLLGASLSVGSVLAAIWVTLVFLTTLYRIVPLNDFGRFYHTAAAYWKSQPMYGWNPTVPGNIPGMNTLDGEEHVVDLLNLNPPHFHLVFLPLALLPVEAAFGLWTVFGLWCAWVSMRLVLHELGADWSPPARQLAWFIFLGSAVTTVMVSLGQIGWVLLLPVTLMWLAARRQQWVRCGLWLGLLASVKPFFLILVPYFLVKGNRRVLLAAASAATGTLMVALPVFGVDSYVAWFATLGPADSWGWLEMNGSLWGVLARSLSDNPLYTPAADLSVPTVKVIWLSLCGSLGLVTLGVACFDRSAQRLDRAFALMLVSALMFSPLGWIYYYPLPLGPLGALVITWRRMHTVETACWARTRWWLFGLSLTGLFLQAGWTRWYQPDALATLTLGNLYFWSLFLIWLTLIRDGLPHVRLPSSGRLSVCRITS